jgi:DNA polymerase III epsilon subunit-like protein
MSVYVVDCESDGPVPGLYSMICFGVVKVEPTLSKTFYGKIKPISENWKPDALSISGFSREDHLTFDEPEQVMKEFAEWIKETSVGKPIFISDNNGYDFSFINYYFHRFYGENPFGWSSRRIGDLYCGMVKDSHAKWKHLRKTIHSHMPIDDAMSNAEVLLEMQKMGLKISLK